MLFSTNQDVVRSNPAGRHERKKGPPSVGLLLSSIWKLFIVRFRPRPCENAFAKYVETGYDRLPRYIAAVSLSSNAHVHPTQVNRTCVGSNL